MKNQILKLLRQRWAKQNKAIPQGLDAVELEKRAEKIEAALMKAQYDGPINANLINQIEASREQIKNLDMNELSAMAEKLGLNDPNKNKFLQPKADVYELTMPPKKIPEGAKIMGGKADTVKQASERGDPSGVFNAMKNDPEYSEIMREFALAKKFPFDRFYNVRSGEDAIPLARKAMFDEETKEMGLSLTPLKDREGTVGEFVQEMKRFKIPDKDIQMMLSSGKSSQVPYVMEQYGMSASDVVDTLKRGDPLIEGMMKGGRVGLKDGPDMNRRNFLKIMGGLASIPIVGKFFKIGKVGKTVSKVPVIKTADVAGKPEWFDALVNKVILEGDDVTKKFATGERQTVHSKTLDDGSVVRVTQDTDQGAVRVEYDSDANVFEDTVQMEYKKPLPDEGDPNPAPEFTTAESGPVGRQTGPDDYDIDVDEVGGTSIKDLDSDVSALKKYATGKLNMKEIVDSINRKKKAQKITEGGDEMIDAVTKRQGDYDPYATGGRAGFKIGSGKKIIQKITKPKKTLKSIEETGTINISDEGIASEFERFMKQTDPDGYAKIQKIVDDLNQKIELKKAKKEKGRKENASGGVAYMLGE
jgi:hypothetical protein